MPSAPKEKSPPLSHRADIPVSGLLFSRSLQHRAALGGGLWAPSHPQPRSAPAAAPRQMKGESTWCSLPVLWAAAAVLCQKVVLFDPCNHRCSQMRALTFTADFRALSDSRGHETPRVGGQTVRRDFICHFKAAKWLVCQTAALPSVHLLKMHNNRQHMTARRGAAA